MSYEAHQQEVLIKSVNRNAESIIKTLKSTIDRIERDKERISTDPLGSAKSISDALLNIHQNCIIASDMISDATVLDFLNQQQR